MSASTRTTLIRLAASILLVLSVFLYFKLAHGQAPITPTITNIQPPNALIDESIEITGTNFGVSDSTNYLDLGLIFINTQTGQGARFGSIKTQTWTDTKIVFKLDHRSSFLHNATAYTIQVDNFGVRSDPFPYQTGSYRVFIPFLSQ